MPVDIYGSGGIVEPSGSTSADPINYFAHCVNVALNSKPRGNIEDEVKILKAFIASISKNPKAAKAITGFGSAEQKMRKGASLEFILLTCVFDGYDGKATLQNLLNPETLPADIQARVKIAGPKPSKPPEPLVTSFKAVMAPTAVVTQRPISSVKPPVQTAPIIPARPKEKDEKIKFYADLGITDDIIIASNNLYPNTILYLLNVELERLKTGASDKAIKAIDTVLAAIPALKSLMLAFHQSQSRENTAKLLSAWQEFSKLLKGLDKELTNPKAKAEFAEILDRLQHHDKQIPKKLTVILAIYDKDTKRLDFRTQVELELVGKIVDSIRSNEKLSRYCIHSIKQDDNPVILAEEGYCFGIGLGISHAILTGAKVEPLVAQVQSHNLKEIAILQEQQSILYETDYEPIKEKQAEALRNYHVFADLERTTASADQFVDQIAAEIHKACAAIKTGEDYAMELGLSPEARTNSGHSIAIVVKGGSYYMVDALSGVYKVDNLKDFHEFVAEYLKAAQWGELYSSCQLTNYPQLRLKLPANLKPAHSGRLIPDRPDSSDAEAEDMDKIKAILRKLTLKTEAKRLHG